METVGFSAPVHSDDYHTYDALCESYRQSAS